MKARELMVGDYVSVIPGGTPIKLAAVHLHKVAYHAYPHKLTWVRESLLRPIPLTPEILEHNGFEQIYQDDKSAYRWKSYGENDPCDRIIIDLQVKSACEVLGNNGKKSYKGRIEYMHELQHELRSCNISKEIVWMDL